MRPNEKIKELTDRNRELEEEIKRLRHINHQQATGWAETHKALQDLRNSLPTPLQLALFPPPTGEPVDLPAPEGHPV